MFVLARRTRACDLMSACEWKAHNCFFGSGNFSEKNANVINNKKVHTPGAAKKPPRDVHLSNTVAMPLANTIKVELVPRPPSCPIRTTERVLPSSTVRWPGKHWMTSGSHRSDRRGPTAPKDNQTIGKNASGPKWPARRSMSCLHLFQESPHRRKTCKGGLKIFANKS